MISFFQTTSGNIIAANTNIPIHIEDIQKLTWLFEASFISNTDTIEGIFMGTKKGIVTPWSTNVVEITRNIGIEGIIRVEEYMVADLDLKYDPILQQIYNQLDQNLFTTEKISESIVYIDNINDYNQQKELLLSLDEIQYLNDLSEKSGRKLTEGEILRFDLECHNSKIFNGTFIIDKEEKENSLSKLIKKTSQINPNKLVSAYKDDITFNNGPEIEQFAPTNGDRPDYFKAKKIKSAFSLKTKASELSTTSKPFHEAASITGSIIRDSIADGKGSQAIAGTAVYMASYLQNKDFRKELSHTPEEMLIKVSDGTADFNNKFGQPLICGSLLTFEHTENQKSFAYDKIVMLVGSIGLANKRDVFREKPEEEDDLIILGTGLNITQANPESQKGISNVVRTFIENKENPIQSIQNLMERQTSIFVQPSEFHKIATVADRERCPIQKKSEYIVGSSQSNFLKDALKIVIRDETQEEYYSNLDYNLSKLPEYLKDVLRLEAVACKDWLTNKVDRSISGKVARQQTQGAIQLPLSDLGAVAFDYRGYSGIATSIGHAPQMALVDPEAGSVMAIAEALTNIVFAPLEDGLKSVSLSANWIWPCENGGEDARLYNAVEACSAFACELGINIPTVKDSFSISSKDNNKTPGTVIISAVGEVKNIRKIVSPALAYIKGTYLYYIDFSFDTFKLGGSAFAQTLQKLGEEVPMVQDSEYFKNAFNAVQELIDRSLVLAGHDISAGGMITAMLEMCFANPSGGLEAHLDKLHHTDLIKILFAENPGILIQVKHHHLVEKILDDFGLGYAIVARPIEDRKLIIQKDGYSQEFDIDELRDIWYEPSYLLDQKQSGQKCAEDRFENYKQQPIRYKIKPMFDGKYSTLGISPNRINNSDIKAAIIRDKGTIGDREMAYALFLAGFDVKDIHMTDLESGRETLEDIGLIAFCGGSSNIGVKGWAGCFKYNEKAETALHNFYMRPDTLSIGVSNGCQLMMELGLIYPEHDEKPTLKPNISQKFESSFLSVDIPLNDSVMFESLSGQKLGIWVAHSEGRFVLPKPENEYNIVAKYTYGTYPGNPNGSDYNVAAICSQNGRHLAIVPHLERVIFPWQCAYYPFEYRKMDVTPWITAFINARKWIENMT